ncbi:hypothetical protein [Delftia tsuruhatensis]|uniref:hypothetical protein n=1 Tax=Delftia tsuruhatensis TaxID=180282 RepID=UPI000A9E556F|nr:hypothetical protein [Delftia tsuruhatensis]
MRNLAISIALSIFLVACDSGEQKNKIVADVGSLNPSTSDVMARPKISKESPDSALKSYWAVKDWIKRVEDDQFKKVIKNKELLATHEAFSSVVSPEIAYRNIYPIDEFNRDIIEAKMETETRASIRAIIKNSTPVPEGAEVTDYDRKRRDAGDEFKYIMEKTNSGWIVSEIWAFDRLFDKKWTKISPQPNKPHVSTLTINGS